MKKRNRILSFLLVLAMVFSCVVSKPLVKVSAAEANYTTKGTTTQIYLSAFAQNTDDWAWMSMGDTASLVYQDVTNFNAIDATSAFAKANGTANFGLQVVDGNLAAGEKSTLKFHIGTVTIKATGYNDVVVNLNKDYSEAYAAEKVSWGITGNNTSILLNDYLPTDAAAKATYLQKITSVKADVTLSEYQFVKPASTGSTSESVYSSGDATKIYASAFAQNTDDWAWMSMGDTAVLTYQTATNVNAINAGTAFASANGTANFGIQIVDGNLAAAEKMTWGLTGNNTQILLNSYLPTDATAKAAYLQKITSVTADVTVTDYQSIKPATATGEVLYTTPGVETKISASAFAQNTDDWAWMSVGDGVSLQYQTDTTLNAISAAGTLAKANATANFGINIVDGNLAAGDANTLKFHVGTVTIKATGYDDLVINLNKDYSEAFAAEKASWGLTGNTKQILLNSYLPTDATAKVNYLQKVTSVTADVKVTDYTFIKYVPPAPEFPADYTHPTEMRGLSAMDLVKDMKIGWNLGNTLESVGGETGWGNPVTTKKMFDTLKAAGFNTVPYSVRWDENYIDANYTIDPAYMARVETVVNYALANDMYAIVNIHHNKFQGQFDEAHKAAIINEGTIVWTQIANHFKDYSDKLIFDTINEPRHEEDWVGTSEYFNVLNEYNAKIVPVIRATGENNAKRLIMVPTYCASSDYPKVAGMVVPNDPNVAVSIHAYIPYNLALNIAPGTPTTFGDADAAFIDKTFRMLNNTFVKKGIPVIIGEFAITDKDNLQDRINFTKFYVSTATAYGMPCLWWDNNNFGSTGERLGLLNRKNLTFPYPELVQAMKDGFNNPRDLSTVDPNVLFSGTASCTGWSTALSLSYGLDFVDTEFTNDFTIAVDYTSENVPQLVLYGNLTGTGWVMVKPSTIKTSATTKTAYFTINDMVSAYKKALANYDSYGKVLPGIQGILVGDTGADLTVTKVYKNAQPVNLLGDVDGNDVVNSLDFELLKKYVLNNDTMINKASADLNKDGKINIIDLAFLKKAI
uniref:Endoglucanase EngE n=1 Tax=Clostridium cellulovorans TaxID=1493 RepID=Q9XD99_CLOCL|nr:endoglucanase EngE [Clostridium cellulovorans]